MVMSSINPNLSKQGVWTVSNDGSLNENLLLNSAGIIIDKQNNTLDSRTEYYAWDVGQSYADISESTQVTISFDLEMLVRDTTGYGGQLQIYNTNNKGLVQISSISYYFKNEYAVGDYIDKRVSLVTTLVPRTDATQQKNFIEFYSGYGTNNFYKISNVKLEKGNKATLWTPNPSDADYIPVSPTSGIIETGNIARVYSNRMDAHEFYEI